MLDKNCGHIDPCGVWEVIVLGGGKEAPPLSRRVEPQPMTSLVAYAPLLEDGGGY